MGNRAPWRARPDDPRTWAGWLACDIDGPARLLASQLAWSIRLLALLALVKGNWIGAGVAIAFSCVPEAVVGSVAYLRGARWLPSSKRFVPKSLPIGHLLSLPSPATPYPCRVEIEKGATTLGVDAGLVTFVEGWLHFKGGHTAFSVRRLDVIRRRDDRLKFAEGGSVVFDPQDWLIAEGLAEEDLAKRFRASLKSWMRSDSPEGESILPPSSPHVSGVIRAGVAFVTSSVATSLLLASIIWVVGRWTSGALLLSLPFVYGLLIAAANVVRLRRLERLAPARPAVE